MSESEQRYPEVPGFKEKGGTSEQAALEVAVDYDLSRMKREILGVLQNSPLTADEVAGQLGLSILTIRPRCSELRLKGLIDATEETRPNKSGKQAWVLALTQRGAALLQEVEG